IVALIGFNLAPAGKANFEKGTLVGLVTLVLLVATLAFFRGIVGRLAIFLAVVAGYVLALILGQVDTSAMKAAAWWDCRSSRHRRSRWRSCRCSYLRLSRLSPRTSGTSSRWAR